MAEEFDTTWFDLKKYNAVKNFKAHDWYFQLEKRHDLIHYIQVYIEKEIKYGEWMKPLYYEKCNKCIESIKDQPIFVDTKQEPPTLSIREAFFSDLDCIRYNHHVDVSKLSFDEFMNIFGSKPITPLPFKLSPNYKFMLTIDINASNEQLKRDFNNWLASYRMSVKEGFNNWHESQLARLNSVANNPGEEPNGSLESDINMDNQRETKLKLYQKLAHQKDREKLLEEKEMYRWHKHRILPYLDLTSIAKATGKKLTQDKIASTLYKDLTNADITKYIRDNLKDLEKLLLDAKTLEALRVQAKSRI